MICCEEMNYVDYFALIKNIKHYKPHRKFLIHVVCYTDSQLINKNVLLRSKSNILNFISQLKIICNPTSYRFLHLKTSTCQSE